MLHKTRGIVLKVQDYAETSVIANIFTEKFGLQSYLINGVKRPKAKIKMNALQALHLLEMVVYHKEHGNLQRIAEIKQSPFLQSIPYDILKSTVAFFLNEMIFKSVRHQSADASLFTFVYNGICWLDSVEQLPGNFHLFFLLQLTRYLGFYPAHPKGEFNYFDLKDGIYTLHNPGHTAILQAPHTHQWRSLQEATWDDIHQINIRGADRKFLLERVIDFYGYHIDYLGEIKSLSILEEVLA